MRIYGFRFCFTPLPGFFSPFPRGTRSLSVTREYLALESGLPEFTPDFTCPALLRRPPEAASPSPTGLSPCLAPLSRGFGWPAVFDFPAPKPGGSYDPGGMNPAGLGSSLFARRYWGNLVDFFSSWYWDVSLPMVVPACPAWRPGGLPLGLRSLSPDKAVSRFGHPRIKRCLLLPADYRSLPRPSSPSGA